MKNKKSTPITPENLIKAGFVVSSNSPLIFKMKKLFLNYSGIAWQTCDEEGHVGTEGNFYYVEDVLALAKKRNLI